MFHPQDVVDNEQQIAKWSRVHRNYTFSWETTQPATQPLPHYPHYDCLISHVTVDGVRPKYLEFNCMPINIDTTRFALPMFALRLVNIAVPQPSYQSTVRFVVHTNYNYGENFTTPFEFEDEDGNTCRIDHNVVAFAISK